MNRPTVELRISAGPGPLGARRFVARLVGAIELWLGALGVNAVVTRVEGARASPRAVVLSLRGAARAVNPAVHRLVGTHRMVESAAARGSRRRWFAAITVVPADAPAIAAIPRDLEIRCVRARGPGGQNVNRRATAVQIRYRHGGTVVRCDEHRTQARNRAAALRRVQELMARSRHADVDAQRAASWAAQRRLTASRCVMNWRADHDGELVLEGADARVTP